MRGEKWNAGEKLALNKALQPMKDAATKHRVDFDCIKETSSPGRVYYTLLATRESKTPFGRLKKFLTGETSFYLLNRFKQNRNSSLKNLAKKIFGDYPIRRDWTILSKETKDPEKRLVGFFTRTADITGEELRKRISAVEASKSAVRTAEKNLRKAR